MGEVVRVYSNDEVKNNIVPFPGVKKPKNRLEPWRDTFAEARELLETGGKVQSFDGIEEINLMVTYYLEHKRFRDACLFVLGCNTSFRISDLREFRWRELLNEDMSIKEGNAKIERKNQHLKHIYVNDAIKEAVLFYVKNLKRPFDIDEYMFVSEGRRAPMMPKLDSKTGKPLLDQYGNVLMERKPITPQLASGIIRGPARELGLYTPDRKISTQSMRQTAADTVDDLMEGRRIPEDLAHRHSDAERSRAYLGHAKASTTSQHYLNTERKVNKKLALWMNLGLEAILEFKEAHPECF